MEVINEIKFTMPSLSVNESAARAVEKQADPVIFQNGVSENGRKSFGSVRKIINFGKSLRR